MRRFAGLMLVALSVPMLSGCVAVIVPAIAASAMGGSSVFRDDAPDDIAVISDAPPQAVTVAPTPEPVPDAPAPAPAADTLVMDAVAPAPDAATSPARMEAAEMASADTSVASAPAAEPEAAAAASTTGATGATSLERLGALPPATGAALEEADRTPDATTPLPGSGQPSPPAQAVAVAAPEPDVPPASASAESMDMPVPAEAATVAEAIVPAPTEMPSAPTAEAPMDMEETAVAAADIPQPSIAARPDAAGSAPAAGPLAGPVAAPIASGEPGWGQMAEFTRQRSLDRYFGRNVSSVVLIPFVDLASPTFTECNDLPLAILVDLDDARLTEGQQADMWLRPEEVQASAEAIALVEQARDANVTVYFLSDQPNPAADLIEQGLENAGLGPATHGVNLWLKGDRGEDRRDTRRWLMARRHCIVAMAGDRRGDFADLFDYLRDPNTSAVDTLNPLWDAGWFVLPNPVYTANSAEGDR